VAAHTRILVLIWAALLCLLALTIGASFLPLGPSKPFVSLAIAVIKAVLIFWFYMHLRELGGLIRLAALAGPVAIAILIALLSADYLTRSWFETLP
jgi:cytochrome c oxidase subunit 4